MIFLVLYVNSARPDLISFSFNPDRFDRILYLVFVSVVVGNVAKNTASTMPRVSRKRRPRKRSPRKEKEKAN